MSQATSTTLQSLMWPDFAHYDDINLSMRLLKSAALASNHKAVTLADGGVVSFDTAFNMFPLRKWHSLCALTDLSLGLRGTGIFEASVFSLHLGQALGRVILAGVFDLTATGLASIDLSDRLSGAKDGVLYLSLRAKGAAELHGFKWQTRQKPQRNPQLTIGITTFKREAAVQATAAKFESFAAHWEHGANLRLIVVDNGQSARLPASGRVTLVPNRNLGGAGGFARCLYEAQRTNATHVLFMDDDAAVDMLALERAWALLAYATDPATTVIGGLTEAAIPEVIWESGAIIHQFCRPLFRGLKLSNFAEAVEMEIVSSAPHPANYYGGFWFFAFPLDHVEHWPFPFFVRGDDINFSLANPFKLVTLPGVVSFQDQDFSDKESALTLYLDLRNHLVQHLVFPKLEFGFKSFASIPMHFFARSWIQNHYDSLLTLNMALEDVMRGPEFFAANADLAQRRADIARLRHYEVWTPFDGAPPKANTWINPHARFFRFLMKLSMNGLFLPFFLLWGNHLVMPRNRRGIVRECWGAAKISYVDAANQQIMTVHHNKLATLRLARRSVANMVRLAFGYRSLKAKWRSGYDGLTSRDFWQKQFFPDQPK